MNSATSRFSRPDRRSRYTDSLSTSTSSTATSTSLPVESVEAGNNLEKLLELFFQHFIVLKMYHFQTKYYSSHKASDAYLSDFLALFDKFMESAQGTFGVIEVTKFNIVVQTVEDETIQDYLLEVAEVLTSLEDFLPLTAKHSDLLNIRDELLGNVNQFIYLLRFQ